MSRFTRAPAGAVSAWAPPESPFRIEYSPALLRELRIAKTGVDAFGILYGVRHGHTIRLIATRGHAGLEPVGIFSARLRGEVFLTEEDLERFEKAEACTALVISGDNAGFFVRDAAGSIETVRSYEEFSILAPEATPKAVKKQWSWAWTLALLPLLFLIPRHPQPPLAIALREDAGQLHISWKVPTQATLVILDGGQKTSIAVAPGLSTLTYARRTGDVTVGIGAAKAHFIGSPLPPTEMETERASIDLLQSKIVSLRAALASRQTKITMLRRRLE